jgi:hypothetical protein
VAVEIRDYWVETTLTGAAIEVGRALGIDIQPVPPGRPSPSLARDR